jgi:3-hydroxy-3-methylglutaryl CoA synthase
MFCHLSGFNSNIFHQPFFKKNAKEHSSLRIKIPREFLAHKIQWILLRTKNQGFFVE